MAIGRLSMKVGKAGKAGPHAAYIAREGQHADRLERGEKLEATAAGNMPAWAQSNPLAFWQAADAFERTNGTTYREMEIALPRELSAAQRAALDPYGNASGAALAVLWVTNQALAHLDGMEDAVMDVVVGKATSTEPCMLTLAARSNAKILEGACECILVSHRMTT